MIGVERVVMRSIDDLTQQEINAIDAMLEGEYYYSRKIERAEDVKYRCFTKSHAIYSGRGVIRVYEYLKSIGVDIDT